jgi:3',5'-cyclic AMP phosphodiesterase CpdA
MLIAQITDPHLRAEGIRLFGAVDTYGALKNAIDHLNAGDPGADAVIITGDLVHDGEAEDYAALTVRLIGLDSLVEGRAHGHLGGDQLAWLDGQLKAAPDRPTLVFVHHPPFATGIAFMDAIGLTDGDALAAVIGKHSHVGLIACGHVHRMIVSRLGGVPVIVGPGVAHHVVFDLAADAPSRWILEPPAYLLHQWSAATGFVTHQVFIGDYGAAVPFSQHHPRIGNQR